MNTNIVPLFSIGFIFWGEIITVDAFFLGGGGDKHGHNSELNSHIILLLEFKAYAHERLSSALFGINLSWRTSIEKTLYVCE